MKKEKIKFETLHKSLNFKKIFIGLLVIVAIGSVVILRGSKANYTYQEIIPFAEGEVRIRKADLNLMAVNLQTEKDCTDKDKCYKKETNVPASGYTVNKENSYCTVDNGTKDVEDSSIPIEYKEGKVYIGVNKKGTRCYIYLDIYDPPKTMQQIIANNYKDVRTRANGTFGSVVTDTTTGTIYESADASQYDDFGKVYYFAGAPTDNWVKFGQIKSNSNPIWWRIIRINGDGSIRMIYAGTGESAPETTGSGTQINDSTAFNSNYKDNTYVGYMYGSTSASSWASAHSNSSNSTIKGVIDSWYNETTNLSGLSTKLSHTAGFCGDRSSSTSSSGTPAKEGGYGTTVTYYGGYVRLVNKNNPTFKCTYASNDLYTTPDDSGIGNKKLSVPIGLITADEVVFAGGVYNTNNKDFYLYTGFTYWTMSPSYFNGSYARVFGVDHLGFLGSGSSDGVTSAYGVRPVINLKADVTFAEGGAGTTNNPYIPT